MRRVEQIMGMPITVDIPDCDDSVFFAKVFDKFHEIDEQFSTYKIDSEVSQFAQGVIKESEVSSELADVIKACRHAEKQTAGYFSAWAGGAFDPSGYVKGWAIEKAGKFIKKQGHGTFCIGAGGDILAASDSAKIWQIGIQDPTDPYKILNKLSITNSAVATSGNYERGGHIINPKTKKLADELLSVTVTGPDIITADMLATAVFAAGRKAGRRILEKFADYEALILV